MKNHIGYLFVLFIFLSGIASSAEPPPPMVAVTPSMFDLEIGAAPTAESFRVINMGKKPMRVRLSLANWELDEDNQVKIIPPTEQSLDQWIVVNPLTFTIPPGQYQTVRFSIRPRVKPLAGEHRGMIYVEQIPPDETATDVRMIFRVGVGVYAHVGEKKRIGKLNSVKVDSSGNRIKALFDVSSEGSAHVRIRGQYAIWRAQEFPGAENTGEIQNIGKPDAVLPKGMIDAGTIPSLPILPGTRRTINVSAGKKLSPGEYIFDVKAKLEGTVIDTAFPFTILPDKQK
jgi:P pilus assembly chaperone PapD